MRGSIHGEECVVIERRDAGVRDDHPRLRPAGLEADHPELVTARQPRLADTIHGAMPRLAVADHERDVELRGGLLEGDAVRPVRRQGVLLIVAGVIAELAAGRRELPAVSAHDVPVQLVDLPVLAAEERVVEHAEAELQEVGIPGERCPALIGRVDRDHPGGLREDPRQVLRELGLERLVRERPAQLHRPVVDVVLGPEAEARLEEGKPRVAIVCAASFS